MRTCARPNIAPKRGRGADKVRAADGHLASNLGLTLREVGHKIAMLDTEQGSGSNSGVECQLPKLDVAGSNPVSRSRSKAPAPKILIPTHSLLGTPRHHL